MKKSDVSSSPYATSAPWPSSLTRLPRATTKWGTTSSTEMTEGHNAEGNHQSNGRVSLRNLLCETRVNSTHRLRPVLEAQIPSKQSSQTEILN